MGKGTITIQSAIDELQRNFKKLNEIYFSGKLERPVITILADSTSGAYGWITKNKVWSTKDEKWYREINLCAEYIHRPPELVIATLLHEMCHLYNISNGIQDTSRSGTYHNKRFKETAEARGLIVGKDNLYGYCITSPSPELISYVKQNCRSGCFKLERMKTYKDGTAKTGTSRTKQSMRKYSCSKCGLTIRSTKNIDDKLMCVDCGEILVS